MRIALTLGILALLVLAACGSPDTTDNTGPNDNTAEQQDDLPFDDVTGEAGSDLADANVPDDNPLADW